MFLETIMYIARCETDVEHAVQMVMKITKAYSSHTVRDYRNTHREYIVNFISLRITL